MDGGSTLADLYDPLTMPGDLLKAHQALDQLRAQFAVEGASGEVDYIALLHALGRLDS